MSQQRLQAATLAVLAALFLAGCATLSAATFPRKPPGPDQSIVEGLVCRDDIEAARVYIADRGGSRADSTERIEKARRTCPPKLVPVGPPVCAEGLVCREIREYS